MGYIKKKEGNLLVPKALFNGHWQTQEKERADANEGDVVFLPQGRRPHRREVWIGHGAAASVMVVFCGLLVVQNLKDSGEEGGRDLAGHPLSAEVVEGGQKADSRIISDFNEGRRDLSSINRASLEQKEYFEHTLLNSYYVSFDRDDLLSEAQLRPEKTPMYIKSHREFLQKNRSFFPKYSKIQNVKKHFDGDEKLHISVYRLTGDEGVSNVSFQTDEQGLLISIIVEGRG